MRLRPCEADAPDVAQLSETAVNCVVQVDGANVSKIRLLQVGKLEYSIKDNRRILGDLGGQDPTAVLSDGCFGPCSQKVFLLNRYSQSVQ